MRVVVHRIGSQPTPPRPKTWGEVVGQVVSVGDITHRQAVYLVVRTPERVILLVPLVAGAGYTFSPGGSAFPEDCVVRPNATLILEPEGEWGGWR